MIKKSALILFFVALVYGLWAIWSLYDFKKADDLSDLIRVESPAPNSLISSPVKISGEARGFWYFEASFPVKLFDADGNLITVKPAQAKSEWMTENFVPFELSLDFEKPSTANGFLVLKKDNPSGLPEYDNEIQIPVRFR